MKKDFIIFGGTGQQGKICGKDLLESGYSIELAGRDPSNIKDLLKNKSAGFIKADLRNPNEIDTAIKKSNADVVINCAELIFNIPIMKACLKNKKSCTDLGGLQKITIEQFKLHNDFRKNNIISITGCGSTPGISNVMTAYAIKKLGSVNTIQLGFAWDSNIKIFVVPYSIQSIFHEFTEDPITFHNGRFVREKRIRCMGRFDFKYIGKQTTYCIVHSEVYTFPKYFKDKKLKNIHYMAGFPQHSFEKIKTLMDLGFNSEEEIEINGIKIKPVDFTTKVLKKLKMPKNYKETENIWIKIEGIKDNKIIKKEMNCIVKTVKGWEEAGSNVDTGRTISIISQMLKNGLIKQKGVYAPEAVIPQKDFFSELSKRKIYVYEDGRKIN
ncbi:MAG: saccharopine dehydrogenase C-terminal domain-containing protein [Nanoarchaeota archaeon]